MAIAAPRVPSTMPADFWLHVADLSAMSGDLDLTTVAGGGGQFAAQVVRLNNATTSALTAVLIPEQARQNDGSASTTSQALVVNAGQQYEPPIPIKKIVKSGSGALSADIYWWYGNSNAINR